MEQTVDQKPSPLPITVETVKAKISIALTAQQLAVQKMTDEAGSLIFNEEDENLKRISEFLAKGKKIEKVINDNHEAIKKPYWEGGKVCDLAKTQMISTITNIMSPVSTKYASLCTAIQTRKRQRDEEEAAEKKILDGINTNIIEFSNRIAACETIDELLDVERKINIQKSPSASKKYGTYHTQAIAKFDEILIPIIRLQKTKVKESAAITIAIKEAEQTNDIDRIDVLTERITTVGDTIRHNQLKVQESALYHAPVVSNGYAREIIPEVKAKRGTWEVELVDMDVAVKWARQYLTISLDKTAAKEKLKELREIGALTENNPEVVLYGIRYYFKQTWS